MTKRGIRRLMILAAGLAVGIAALAGAYFYRQAMIEKQTEEAAVRGLELYAEGKGEYEEAFLSLEEAVKRRKNDPELLKAFARCRAAVELPNGRHMPSAIAAARAAIELAPADRDAYLILFDLYQRVGYQLEVIELAERILAIDPDLPDVRAVQVLALQNTDRDEEALEKARLFAERMPLRLDAHQLVQDCLLRSGTPDTDLLVYAQSVSGFDDDPRYHLWVAGLAMNARDLGTAEAEARLAASMPAPSAKFVVTLDELLRKLDRRIADARRLGVTDPADATAGEPSLLDLADRLFAQAIENPGIGEEVASEAAKREWWNDDSAQAIRFAERITPELPGSVDPEKLKSEKERLAWAGLVQIGERPELGFGAESPRVASYVKAAGEDWQPLLLAMDALRSGEHESVPAMLADFKPDDSEMEAVANYVRGVALQRIGDFTGSALALRSAAETGGIARDRAWRALGDVYTYLGRFDEAVNAYSSMTDSSSSGLAKLDLVLQGAERSGNRTLIRQVVEILEDGADSEASEPNIVARLARAYLLQGRTDEGVELARGLIGTEPSPDPMGTLGLVRTLDKYAPQAAEEIRIALLQRTDSIELLASQASIKARAGDLDAARALLEQQLEGKSPNAALPYRRALVRVLDEVDADDALAEARRLSDEYPGSATAQLSVLKTQAIWTDLAAARTAVTRLKEAAGDESLMWQTYDARVMLESNPTQSDFTDIVTNLSQVLKASPEHFDALLLMGRAYEAIAASQREANPAADVREFIDQAATRYSLAAGADLKAAAFRPLIEMLLNEGRITQANRELDRFVSLSVMEVPMRFRLQRRDLLIQAGRWAEAAEEQRDFAGFATPQSVLDLANMYIKAGDNAQAAEVLEQFLSHQSWPATELEAAADLLANAGYHDRAIEVFTQIGETHNGERIGTVIARAMARTGRSDLALGYQLEAARSSGQLGDWLNAIRVASSLGAASLDEVLAEARRAFPDSPELESFAGQSPTRPFAASTIPIVEQDGAGTEAGAALLRVLRSHARGESDSGAFLDALASVTTEYPASVLAWQLRIQSLFQLGRIDDAVQASRDAAAATPESAPARSRLVNILRQVGALDEAARVAEDLMDMTSPSNYDAAVMLGLIEIDRGNFARTVELLARYRSRIAGESTEKPSTGLMALAIGYAGAGNPAETDALVGSGARAAQAEWQMVLLRAARVLPVSEAPVARRWLARINAPSLAANAAEMWLSLANNSGDAGDAGAALAIATEDRASASANWLWIRGRALALLGRTSEAERAFRDLIMLSPEEISPRVALADLLSREPDRGEDAVSAIQDAREHLGDASAGRREAAILATAEARVLLSRSMPEDALGVLAPFVEGDEARPETLVLAAMCHLNMGNQNQASSILESIPQTGALDARTRAALEMVKSALSGE